MIAYIVLNFPLIAMNRDEEAYHMSTRLSGVILFFHDNQLMKERSQEKMKIWYWPTCRQFPFRGRKSDLVKYQNTVQTPMSGTRYNV